MLRQYRLNGGIRKPRPRLGQSKHFGTTTTMAAPTAPAPWNRPPPSVDDFRWWDNIFLKISLPEWLEETPMVHKKISAELRHGHTHELLVSKLKRSFSTANAARFAVPQEDETLKKTQIHPPQTTQPRYIRRNQLGTIPYAPRRNPHPPKAILRQPLRPGAVLRAIHRVPERAPKRSSTRQKNKGIEVRRRSLPLSEQ